MCTQKLCTTIGIDQRLAAHHAPRRTLARGAGPSPRCDAVEATSTPLGFQQVGIPKERRDYVLPHKAKLTLSEAA